ncbi:hypothetical protein M3J09_006275 [Ascochyta lentis]
MSALTEKLKPSSVATDLEMKRFRMKLLLSKGEEDVMKEGEEIPIDLEGFLTSEFEKLLKWTAAKTTAWNKLVPDEKARALLRVIAKKGVSLFNEDLRACDTCSLTTASRKVKARPCALLQEGLGPGNPFLSLLPLREELRQVLTWDQRGY